MYVGVDVQYPLLLSDFNETCVLSKKYSNIKFHENPASGKRVVSCGRTVRCDESTAAF